MELVTWSDAKHPLLYVSPSQPQTGSQTSAHTTGEGLGRLHDGLSVTASDELPFSSLVLVHAVTEQAIAAAKNAAERDFMVVGSVWFEVEVIA